MKKILGLGKVGLALFLISIALIVGVYFLTPSIETLFGTEILVVGNDNVNFFIRLYGGFLASSALTLTAQLVVYVLEKSIVRGMQDDVKDDIKTVRNFSVYALLILAAILYFVAGKTIVRI